MIRVVLDWLEKEQKGIIVSDFLENIRLAFSVPNKTERIVRKRFGNTHVPKRYYAITPAGRFDLGLYFNILQYFQTSSYQFDVTTTDLLKSKVMSGFDISAFDIPQLNLKLRDYQLDSVKRSLKYGYGLIVVGTGGGKTLIAALIERCYRKLISNPFTALYILPANIVEQTYKKLIEYGVPIDDISFWNGKNEFKKCPIIIVNYETLYAKFVSFKNQSPEKEDKFSTIEQFNDYLKVFQKEERERKKNWKKEKERYLDQLKDVELIILDEAHTLRRGNQLNKIIDLFSTPHKYGFTGTLPEDDIDKWNIIGKIGPIIKDIGSAELRDQGYLTKVKTQILKIIYKNPPKPNIDFEKPTAAYREECDFIYNNEFRNEIISKICQNTDNNMLIMVDRLEHGSLLFDKISKLTNKETFWIRGEVEMEDREKVRELMEKKNNIICIAMSKIFSTGIDITNLHYILFAQGGKAKITLIQSIGRGLRIHNNKSLLVVIDVADMTHYGEKHLETRLQYYKGEQIEYEAKNLCEP